MFERETITDLLAYHRWANEKLLGLCRPLTDEQLDREEPIGPGSLRKTLYHAWAAESLWLSRWKGVSPTTFPAESLSIEELAARFDMIHAARDGFLEEETPRDLSGIVSYRTLAGDAYSNRLIDLVMHVVNHAVHHRAQALHFLKLAGVTVPGGLDYTFYRIARPTVAMPDEMRQKLRGYGLEVGASPAEPIQHSKEMIDVYFAYGDWGTARTLEHAAELSDADLDRDFGMGMGTLRKSLLHLYDVEEWWRGNWRGDRRVFQRLPAETRIDELEDLWKSGANERNAMLADLPEKRLTDPVTADFGSGPMAFRIGESMIQLGVHGTHHRAQATNMLRRLGVSAKPSDLVVFLRERG
jgi:uncharacterized damage-inducible protein DinB